MRGFREPCRLVVACASRIDQIRLSCGVLGVPCVVLRLDGRSSAPFCDLLRSHLHPRSMPLSRRSIALHSHTPSQPDPSRDPSCASTVRSVQISYGEQSTSMYRAACSVYRIVPTLPSVPCRTRSPTRRLASSSTSRAQLEARLGSPLAHPTLNAQDHGHARSHPRLPRPRSRPRPRPSLPRAPHPLDRIIWPPGHHHHHPSPSSHPGPRSILDPRRGHLDITSPPCAVDRSGQPSAICHPAGAIIDGPSSLRSE